MKTFRRSTIVSAVLLAAVAAIPASSAPGAYADECPTSVVVENVKPLRGLGYSWVKATYEGGDPNAAPPSWEISEGADIRAYEDDPMHAYMMAPTGNYKVRAIGPCGIAGEVLVRHVALEASSAQAVQ